MPRFLQCEETLISQGFAPYKSHNPATFCLLDKRRFAGCQWGLPALSLREQAIFHEAFAFS